MSGHPKAAAARAAPLDHLARPQLAGFAQLLLPVDLHHAAGHEPLRGAAAVRHAGGLEERVERDELAAQCEIDVVHSRAAPSMTRSDAACATQGRMKPCAFSSASRPGHSMW